MKDYSEAPYIISGKDLDYLYDIFSWNYNACKLTSNFTNAVIDPEIKDILKKISDIHKEHAKAVLNILG